MPAGSAGFSFFWSSLQRSDPHFRLAGEGREFMIKIQGLTKVDPTGKAALNCATYLLLSGSQGAGPGRWIPWMF